MNKDLQKAISSLEGHSIVLVKGEELLLSDLHGIAPMMDFIKKGRDLDGFSAADLIVGKAAAMLFAKAKIKAVYGKVMSLEGLNYLQSHGIEASYGTLVEQIINRAGTGICPMEATVSETSDFEEGYTLLFKKLESLKNLKKMS